MPNRRTRPAAGARTARGLAPGPSPRWGEGPNTEQASEAFRLLDSAVARLVGGDGTDYTLSLSSQAGQLQDCGLEAGRLSGGGWVAPDAPGAAPLAKVGLPGAEGHRGYNAALEALADAITTLTESPAVHGAANLRLRADPTGAVRLPVEVEIILRRRFGA